MNLTLKNNMAMRSRSKAKLIAFFLRETVMRINTQVFVSSDGPIYALHCGGSSCHCSSKRKRKWCWQQWHSDSWEQLNKTCLVYLLRQFVISKRAASRPL